jgi:hypothetical protein
VPWCEIFAIYLDEHEARQLSEIRPAMLWLSKITSQTQYAKRFFLLLFAFSQNIDEASSLSAVLGYKIGSIAENYVKRTARSKKNCIQSA